MNGLHRWALITLALQALPPACASAQTGGAQPPAAPPLQACADIEDPVARLACYDRLVQPRQAPGTPAPAPLPSAPEPAPLTEARRSSSLIGDRWSLGVSPRDSRFDLRPHQANYFMPLRFSDRGRAAPNSPTQPPPEEPQSVKRAEAKFQVSFKLKVADFEDALGASLWGAYTQQNHWQLYNGGESRPFRETNYEPELLLAWHPERNLFGWQWRLFTLGLNHQSNGRDDPLSRSWGRLTAQFGFEQGPMAVFVRPWIRVRRASAKDDNPDIERFLGHGDLTGVYRYREHTFSALARYNPGSGKGALQASWSFPLNRRLRGYLQGFSGYGESLIDYNIKQNTLGIGISLAEFL